MCGFATGACAQTFLAVKPPPHTTLDSRAHTISVVPVHDYVHEFALLSVSAGKPCYGEITIYSRRQQLHCSIPIAREASGSCTSTPCFMIEYYRQCLIVQHASESLSTRIWSSCKSSNRSVIEPIRRLDQDRLRACRSRLEPSAARLRTPSTNWNDGIRARRLPPQSGHARSTMALRSARCRPWP
jgi:hypothetical protein